MRRAWDFWDARKKGRKKKVDGLSMGKRGFRREGGGVGGGGGGEIRKRGEYEEMEFRGAEKGQNSFPLLPKLHRKIRLSVTAKTTKITNETEKTCPPPPPRTYMITANDPKNKKLLQFNVDNECVMFHQ